jgi:hypothetical protein
MRRRQTLRNSLSRSVPSGRPSDGPVAGEIPPPVSREQEEAYSKIWADPLPVKPPLQIQPKRNRLSLKKGKP